ncbi:MAG: phosphatase PAP2 family protein [Planctomycetes bacterium]|nr:phosphatase PAP2 family protein [Planctomycetota bacterium]
MTRSASLPAVRSHDRRIVAALAALLCGALTFLVLSEAGAGRLGSIDRWTLAALRDAQDRTVPLGPAWLPSAARDVTALGSHVVLLLATAASALVLTANGRVRSGLRIVCACLGGMLLSAMLKALFGHPRPDVAAFTEVFSTSFPSGHALISAAVYPTIAAVLAARTPHPLPILLMGGALLAVALVGATRAYLGVHYPSEVLAGWIAGGCWALCCGLIAEHPITQVAGAPAKESR